MKKWETRFQIYLVLAMLNFCLFIVETMLLNGDGLTGYAAAGHFYVASHGHFTEVPGIIWLLSRAHAISVFVSFLPFAAYGIYYTLRGESRRNKP